jgi:hypothetical protein
VGAVVRRDAGRLVRHHETVTRRPPISLPSMPAIAAFASSAVEKVTNPKPRDFPVSRSKITFASVTVPKL